jgi:hypothetical protein
MNRLMIERHLAQAREHIASGTRTVTKQREMVARLERGGHDVTAALHSLAQFEDMLALYISDCNRIEKELAENTE